MTCNQNICDHAYEYVIERKTMIIAIKSRCLLNRYYSLRNHKLFCCDHLTFDVRTYV